MENIYNSPTLTYPLLDTDYEKLDEVWEFIENFNNSSCTLHGYRSKIIETMKQKYTCEEFYILELIAEKLFWNLRNKTYKIFFIEDNQNTGRNIDDLLGIKEGTREEMLDYMYNDNSYRSFINKLILIDDVNNKCYYKKIEGSANIFNKNPFNLYTATVLFNRNLYESVMENPEKINNIYVPEYYYEHDYPFPNLNFGKPFIQTQGFRMKRINKMYYDVNAEGNWFRLLIPKN